MYIPEPGLSTWKPPLWVRSRVFFRGDRVHSETYDTRNGTILVTDNTGKHGWQDLLRQAEESAFAFNRVLRTGHRLVSWDELLDELLEYN